jgi:hypothetical protein
VMLSTVVFFVLTLRVKAPTEHHRIQAGSTRLVA